MAEVKQSKTVVYDVTSYARADNAVGALLAGSPTLSALMTYFGKQPGADGKDRGKGKLFWALVIALIEAHMDAAEPVKSFGYGNVHEYGRKLFGGEAQAIDIYRKEGWTIWTTAPREPRDCLEKQKGPDDRMVYLVPLGCSRRVLTRLRVRSSARSCPWDDDPSRASPLACLFLRVLPILHPLQVVIDDSLPTPANVPTSTGPPTSERPLTRTPLPPQPNQPGGVGILQAMHPPQQTAAPPQQTPPHAQQQQTPPHAQQQQQQPAQAQQQPPPQTLQQQPPPQTQQQQPPPQTVQQPPPQTLQQQPPPQAASYRLIPQALATPFAQAFAPPPQPTPPIQPSPTPQQPLPQQPFPQSQRAGLGLQPRPRRPPSTQHQQTQMVQPPVTQAAAAMTAQLEAREAGLEYQLARSKEELAAAAAKEARMPAKGAVEAQPPLAQQPSAPLAASTIQTSQVLNSTVTKPMPAPFTGAEDSQGLHFFAAAAAFHGAASQLGGRVRQLGGRDPPVASRLSC